MESVLKRWSDMDHLRRRERTNCSLQARSGTALGWDRPASSHVAVNLAGRVDVHVDRRAGNASMPEQHLHRAQIGPQGGSGATSRSRTVSHNPGLRCLSESEPHPDRFGFPSMGGNVKAQVSRAPAIMVLISGVRVTVRRVGTGQLCVIRDGVVRPVRGASRCSQSSDGFGIEAASFSSKGGNHPSIRASESHCFVR
jgi:hypothetical protein